MRIGSFVFAALVPFACPEEHIIPTLLFSREHDGSKLVNALENPLYEELLHQTTFIGESPKTISLEERFQGRRLRHERKHIWLDKNEVSLGDSIRVNWDNAKTEDLLTLHCPADEDHKFFREAIKIGSILKNQQGLRHNYWHIHSFPVVREGSCEFRLWDKSSENTRYLRSHAPFVIINGEVTPTGIHLSHTTEPSSINVHFTTGVTGIPVVNFGMVDTLDLFQEGESQTYTASDLCHPPANIIEPGKFSPPGMLHTVMLQGLVPDTSYSYRVGVRPFEGGDIFWSKTYSFKASPPVGTFPVSILAIADQGCSKTKCPGVKRHWGEGSEDVISLMSRENNIHAIHAIGDLSYAKGAAHVWDIWMEMIQPYAARVPVMVSLGNHDYNYDTGGEGKDPTGENKPYKPDWGNYGKGSNGECGVPVAARFNGSGNGNHVFWYSYDLGGIHFVIFMTEQDVSQGSRQYAWLEADLRSVDRKKTPWVVLEAHRPMYNSLQKSERSAKTNKHIREEIEGLLYQYKVDVVFGGHYHAYLRTCNGLYQSKCDNGGATYITIGTGGAAILKYPLYEQQWTEKVLFEYGCGRMTAWNKTALHFEFVGVDGDVKDDVWIKK